MDVPVTNDLGRNLREWKRLLAEEVGTMPPCPFCRKPRVARSDYLRCNLCGVNWLAEEMSLPDYLNLDPRVARARMAKAASSSAGSSRVDASDAA
jgi:ribosomal protein L37AE/L43A